MDILVPSGANRVPQLQRNAGGRLFHTGAELNAFITKINASQPASAALPLAPNNARFSDSFNSFDLRLSKVFRVGERVKIEPLVEAFNLFNITNVLGFSKSGYSGFGNVLGSSSFGRPVTTAGGVFGSGGPRAFQFAARVTF